MSMHRYQRYIHSTKLPSVTYFMTYLHLGKRLPNHACFIADGDVVDETQRESKWSRRSQEIRNLVGFW